MTSPYFLSCFPWVGKEKDDNIDVCGFHIIIFHTHKTGMNHHFPLYSALFVKVASKLEFKNMTPVLVKRGSSHIDFLKTFLQMCPIPQVRVHFFILISISFHFSHQAPMYVASHFLCIVNESLLLHKK